MFNLFYDFFPILLFFIVFKIYGIYAATVVGIIATALQVVISFFVRKKWDKKQLITLVVFILFGGMTLYFHNPIFVKWKPSIIYWIFSVILLLSHFIGEKTIIQRLLESVAQGKDTIPQIVWKRLSYAWIVFFALLGAVNLYVAYRFSTEAWVNFKIFGVMGLLLLFIFIQAICLARYMVEK